MPKQNGLVGPKGHFLLGNLPEFQRDELAFLMRCAQEYHDIVPVRMLHLSAYLLLNPAYIEYVLATHRHNFAKSRIYKIATGLLGDGLLMSEGEIWLRQRRLMQPAFHHERIEAYSQIMITYAERMLSGWQDGQILDVNLAMQGLAMEIAVKTLFHSDIADDLGEIGAAFALVLKDVVVRFSNPFPIPESIPTPSNVRYRKALQYLNKVIYELIRQRRAKPADTGDLLSMLLLAEDENHKRMTDQQIRDEAITIFIGGYATTAATLAWSWYLLSQHPEVEAKLLAELASVLGGRTPTLADLPKLRYTEMVVKETLRLFSPVCFISREALKDFEMGDHHFPAGTEVWITPWVIHRSPRFFEAPEAFRPERWEGDLEKRLPKFAYFPFSGGPRVCIGNTFALMEAKLVLAIVTQKFQLKLLPEQVVAPKFSGTLEPKEGIKMMLARRPASESAYPTIPAALSAEL